MRHTICRLMEEKNIQKAIHFNWELDKSRLAVLRIHMAN
jgi:hypothetical protein